MDFSDHSGTIDQSSPHTLATAYSGIWATGGWSVTVKGKDCVCASQGYHGAIYVREGDNWKKRNGDLERYTFLSISVTSGGR